MNDATRDALRELLGSSVLEVHDFHSHAPARCAWRVRVAGRVDRVIVEAAVGEGGDADEEWQRLVRSAEALTTARASGVVPDVVALDERNRILVVEDVGERPSVADVVASADPTAREQGVIAFVLALARLHTATAAADGTSLLHGRPCPHAGLVRGDGDVALIGFEHSERGDAKLDLDYVLASFPGCSAGEGLPSAVLASAEEAYRSAR